MTGVVLETLPIGVVLEMLPIGVEVEVLPIGVVEDDLLAELEMLPIGVEVETVPTTVLEVLGEATGLVGLTEVETVVGLLTTGVVVATELDGLVAEVVGLTGVLVVVLWTVVEDELQSNETL
jgi:hypothetical protein